MENNTELLSIQEKMFSDFVNELKKKNPDNDFEGFKFSISDFDGLDLTNSVHKNISEMSKILYKQNYGDQIFMVTAKGNFDLPFESYPENDCDEPYSLRESIQSQNMKVPENCDVISVGKTNATSNTMTIKVGIMGGVAKEIYKDYADDERTQGTK